VINKLFGILYQSGKSFHMHSVPQGDAVSLDSVLQRVEGTEVRLFLQNAPDGCRWGGSGLCPAGHHDAPDLVLTFQEQGTLQSVDGAWRVGAQAIPFHLYEGHVCQFEVFPSEADLRERALRLQSLLRKVRDL